ncbi:DUF1127 domain-containing protein [Oleomonas cavernae]|nr:DUF1127 domain-containing protein [Oleomonas cavernae]
MSTIAYKTNTTSSFFSRLAANMIADHAAWRQRRATRRELSRLGATSKHLLRDIGIEVVEAERAPAKGLFTPW